MADKFMSDMRMAEQIALKKAKGDNKLTAEERMQEFMHHQMKERQTLFHEQAQAQHAATLRHGEAAQKAGAAFGGGKIEASSASDFQSQLQYVIAHDMKKVIDVFRDWDEDGSGTIDKKEFRKAVKALGLMAPQSDVDALFDSFDNDGGGSIDCARAHPTALTRTRPTALTCTPTTAHMRRARPQAVF